MLTALTHLALSYNFFLSIHNYCCDNYKSLYGAKVFFFVICFNKMRFKTLPILYESCFYTSGLGAGDAKDVIASPSKFLKQI